MPLAQKSSSAYKLHEESYFVPERVEKQEAHRPAHQKQEYGIGKLKIISMVLLCFGVAFYVLLRYVAINEASNKVDRLKQQLVKMEGSNQQMQIELDRSIDLKKVEEVAINKLGMRRPEKYQTVYINLNNNDYVEMVNDTGKNKSHTGTFAVVMKTINNVLEYLY